MPSRPPKRPNGRRRSSRTSLGEIGCSCSRSRTSRRPGSRPGPGPCGYTAPRRNSRVQRALGDQPGLDLSDRAPGRVLREAGALTRIDPRGGVVRYGGTEIFGDFPSTPTRRLRWPRGEPAAVNDKVLGASTMAATRLGDIDPCLRMQPSSTPAAHEPSRSTSSHVDPDRPAAWLASPCGDL